MATIRVTGRAQVSVPPDEATLTLRVEAVAATPTEALAEVAERARTLFALLDELDVPLAKRSTRGVSVAEAGEHDPQGRWQHRGYRALEQLSVTVGDAETVGTLLGEAVARARAHVEGPFWTVAAGNPARNEALRLAAEDARRRAEAAAEGLGVRLGALVEAVEGEAAHPIPRTFGPLAVADGPPIEAGEATIASAVTATFQVEAE